MERLSHYAPLTPAEEKLVTDCVHAPRVTLGGGDLPLDENDENHVRAVVLRHLLVSEEIPVNEKGLRLAGAWISGTLDLQGADSTLDLSLVQCVLTGPAELVNARLRGIYVSGCRMQRLSADNAKLDGSLFLRAETHVEGEISLAGCHVNGDVQMCDLTITSEGQDAVFAPSLHVDGSVYLGNYPYSAGTSTLMADGGFFMPSINVRDDVFITNTGISIKSELPGEPVFSASEEHGSDMALSLARARIGGVLYLRDNQISRGILNLAGAEVSHLRDETPGPGAGYLVRLDGFRYADFTRHTETSVASRLEWLERRPETTAFSAQPYEQLARVLRNRGQRNDAMQVLMTKERLLRAEDRRVVAATRGRGLHWVMLWLVDVVMRYAVGYGYKPGRVLGVALVLIVGLGIFFQKTWDAGDMAPNAGPILVSRDWIAATETHPDNPAAFWSQPGQAGQDWETFNGFAYAADIVVPIVSLGQEEAWAPSTSRSPLGRVAWWVRWFAKALGWIVAALGAAAVTGAVRND